MKTKRLTSVHVSCNFFMDLTQNGEEFSGYLRMTCDCTDYENGSYI